MSFEDLCGKGASQIGFDQVDIPRAAQYACEDADMTLAVHQRLWPLLEADAVRQALSLLGVPESQLEAVSFGKEKPLATGSSDADQAQNRRVEIRY